MILLFIFRTSIPLFKYPFLILFVGFSIYIIIYYWDRLLNVLKEFLRNYLLLILLAIILFFSFLFSDKIYLSVFKDIVNVFILFYVYSILMLVVSSRKKFDYFVSSFLNLIIIFAFFISILRVLDLFDIFHYTNYFSNYDSLFLDYNFALLPELFGIVSISFLLTQPKSRLQKICYNLMLIFFYFHIFLSGSRRGLFVLVIISIIIIVALIINLFKKNELLRHYASNSKLFFLWLVLMPLLSYFYFFHTSYDFKSNSLKYIGTKSGYTAKKKITLNLYRYTSIFDKSLKDSLLYIKMWSVSFDPKDPDNGWGVEGVYKIVSPLTGKNVEIVPFGAKGYLLDNKSRFGNSEHHAYSFTIIGNSKVNKGDIVNSSVYCYVSDDFNGEMVCIRSEGATYGDYVNHYDLNRKGVWQKLSISASCNNGKAPVYLYFNKQGVTDFSTLKGFVIYAYPEYKIKVANDSCKSSFSLFDTKKLNQAGFFNLHLPILIRQVSPNDNDPFRNFVSRFISEDTTYHGYQAEIVLGKKYNRFIDQRLLRWKFALQIFSKEFNWPKKIFGGGFNFLNWYGYFFLGDKTKDDYPHNPFLYILLYSGIIGLLLYLLALFYVFSYYIKYVKKYYPFFIFFLITFFFNFFSGGDPFSPSTMGFFVVLPFFIHSIFRKDKA